jgi:hypothetical protein
VVAAAERAGRGRSRPGGHGAWVGAEEQRPA